MLYYCCLSLISFDRLRKANFSTYHKNISVNFFPHFNCGSHLRKMINSTNEMCYTRVSFRWPSIRFVSMTLAINDQILRIFTEKYILLFLVWLELRNFPPTNLLFLIFARLFVLLVWYFFCFTLLFN